MGAKSKAKRDEGWRSIFDAYWARASGIPKPWSRVSKRVRMAVSLGLFHTQMRRNGAQMWVTNGYAKRCSRQLLARLGDLDSPRAREAAAIVKDLQTIASRADRRERELADLDSDGDPVLDALAARCDELDERYGSLGPALMREVDAWLHADADQAERERLG